MGRYVMGFSSVLRVESDATRRRRVIEHASRSQGLGYPISGGSGQARAGDKRKKRERGEKKETERKKGEERARREKKPGRRRRRKENGERREADGPVSMWARERPEASGRPGPD
jgi:hypothetical protein